MTSSTTTRTSASADLFAAVRRIYDEALVARARRKVYNKTYSELSAMTDHDLADIGINRLMIEDIAARAAADA